MSNLNLGLDMASLELGLKKDVISGVILHAGQTDSGETLDFTAGSTSGEVLEVTVPHGDQEMAQTILDGLKKRGFRYQPFTSGNTHTDPAVEIGDNVTVNSEPSVVMGIQLNHSRLMASTLKAPYEEELDHEFKYEPRTQREFKREAAYTRSRLAINEEAITAEVIRASSEEARYSAQLKITADAITAEVARASAAEGDLSGRIQVTADAITAEVTRATTAEGSLSSSITANANAITAEVTRATGVEGTLQSSITANATAIAAKVSASGGSSSSFGWELTSTAWELKANNSTTFKATSSGIEVTGKIAATSGYIGSSNNGFTIDSYGIKKGMTSLSDTTNNGVYVGTDGIALGGGKFKATSSGAVTASNVQITGGSIQIKDANNNVAFEVTSTGALTATTGSFRGSVSAGNIQYGTSGGVNHGTFNASGLSDGSISSTKYERGSIFGGTDVDGIPTGSLAANTVAYGNASFTGILDQVGYNAADITAMRGYFTGTASFEHLSTYGIQLIENGGARYGFLYLDYIDNVPVVKWRYTS